MYTSYRRSIALVDMMLPGPITLQETGFKRSGPVKCLTSISHLLLLELLDQYRQRMIPAVYRASGSGRS